MQHLSMNLHCSTCKKIFRSRRCLATSLKYKNRRIYTYFTLFLYIMLQLPSHYTSQHSRVCTVHLALTLSNHEFVHTHVFFDQTSKDTMWTQALLSDKQVVKMCRTVSSLGRHFKQKSFKLHLVPRLMRALIIGRWS